MIETLFSVGLLRFVSIGLAILFIFLVGVYFSPAEFAKFSLSLSVIQIGSAAILSWPNRSFLRFGREAYNTKANLGEPFAARLVIHAVLLVLMLVLVLLFYKPLSNYINVSQNDFVWLLIGGILLLPASEMSLIVAQICGKFTAHAFAPIVQKGIQLGVICAVLAGFIPNWQLLLLFSILGYLFSSLLLWTRIPKTVLSFHISVPEIIRALRYSWAMPFSALGALLIQWMDIWFIRHYLDESSAGHYAWAYSVTILTTSILVPLSAVLALTAIDLELEANADGLTALLKKIFSVCMFFGALLPIGIICIAIVGHSIIPVNYLISLPVMLLLLAATLCQMGMSFVESIIYARVSLVSKMMLIVLAMVFVKAAVNIALISKIGMAGSAIATILCYGIGMLLQWRMIGARLEAGNLNAWPIFITALISMGFAATWQGNTIAFIISGCSSSLALIILFRYAGWLTALPDPFKKILGHHAYHWLSRS